MARQRAKEREENFHCPRYSYEEKWKKSLRLGIANLFIYKERRGIRKERTRKEKNEEKKGRSEGREREPYEKNRDGRERERLGQMEEREIEWLRKIEKSGEKGGIERKKS